MPALEIFIDPTPSVQGAKAIGQSLNQVKAKARSAEQGVEAFGHATDQTGRRSRTMAEGLERANRQLQANARMSSLSQMAANALEEQFGRTSAATERLRDAQGRFVKTSDAAARAMEVASRSSRGYAAANDNLTRVQGIQLRSGMALAGMYARLSGAMALAGGAGLSARGVIETAGEFQRLEASLETVTGSASRAQEALAFVTGFASTTPYDLQQVTESFIKLQALGLDSSRASMTAWGNTAAAMGKSMMQYIEAVADATTGEFERLKEFGTKAKQDGDRVALTFRGNTTVIKNSAQQIERYLRRIGEVEFAGAMERQMRTLPGAISNAQDAIQRFQNEIGEGGFADAVRDAANALSAYLNANHALARDTGAGLGTAFREGIEGAKAFGGAILEVSDFLGTAFRLVTNDIVGAFVGGYEAAVTVWNALPGAFGSLGASAANLLISAVEMAVNKVVSGINTIIGAINAVSSYGGLPEIGKVAEVAFGRMEAAAGASTKALLADAKAAYQAGASQDFVGKAVDAATAKLQERRQAAADAVREQAKFDARLDQSKAPDYLHKTGAAGKDAGEGLKEAAKAAKEAEAGFNRLESAAERALEKLDPAEALRRQGAELQKLMDQYGSKLDPVLRKALQTEIDLNLSGKELEPIKQQVNELADDIASTLSKAFEDAFTTAGAGFDDLFQNIGKSFSSMGFQAFQTNVLKPMMGGLMGGAANDNTFMKDLRSTIEAGTKNGTGAAWESIVSSSSMAYNKNGGMVGAGIAGIGGVVGAYQGGVTSQSPMMGAIGGALSGAGIGATIGGPIGAAAGAVIGGIVGLVGGIVGASDSAEKKMAEAQKRLNAQEEAIEAMRASWRGEGLGTIQAWRAENNKAATEAKQLARRSGNSHLANQIGDDYRAGQKRQVEAFRQSFNLMIDSLRDGSGPGGPLVTARQAVLDLVEGFKSFIADTKDVGKNVREAEGAVRASLLGVLNPREFTEVEAAMDTLRGTAAGVRAALGDLGMSATAAGDAVKRELNEALDDLRGKFLDGLRERINDATGKGYLNDINAAIRQREEDLKSAQALGVSNGLVQQAFQATVQEIVSGADLTDKAFAKLKEQFPFLTQAVEEATDSIADSIRTAQMAISSFRIGLLTSPENPMGPDAALAAATTQYQTTLAQARDTSDPTRQLNALNDLPSAAQTYLEAAQEMWATSEQYGAIFSQVLADLGTVDGPRSDADRIVAKLEENRQAVVANKSVLDLIRVSNDNLPEVLKALGVSNASLAEIDLNGDGAISKMEAVRALTAASDTKLGTIEGSNKTTAEKIEAVRALAATDSTVLRSIDTNGDNTVSKVEAVRALADAQDAKLGLSNNKLDRIDLNGDGAITKLEAVRALNNAQDSKLSTIGLNTGATGAIRKGVDANAVNVNKGLTATVGATGTNTKKTAEVAAHTKTANEYTDAIASQYYGNAIFGLKESLKLLFNIARNTYALDYDSQRPYAPTATADFANFVWSYATGGWVNGPGTSTSDSIPARLSNGEFVVNAAAARANAGLLGAINDNKVINLDPVVTSIHQAATAQIAELRKMRQVLERLEGHAGAAARTSAREASQRPTVGVRSAGNRPGR